MAFVPTGRTERAAMAYMIPSSRADLVQRRQSAQVWCAQTFGFIGRGPDFVATVLMAFASASSFFGSVRAEYKENVERFYEKCASEDPFLAHATINPPKHRDERRTDQRAYGRLRVVQEKSDFLIVRGLRMISTMAPVSNDLVVFPLSGYDDGDDAFTVAFWIPVATPGLKLVCREPSSMRSVDGLRVSDWFDEMDATVIFDDVRIPRDNVFFSGDPALANRLYDITTARHHAAHHGAIRAAAKSLVTAGVAIELAEASGASRHLHVQEMLGELLSYHHLIRGALLLAESEGYVSQWGSMCPSLEPLLSVRYQFPQMYQRMLEVIQIVGAGSLISAPTKSDLKSPIGELVRDIFQTGGSDSWFRLLKLGWEIAGSAFGQRQLQYERYHAGDPVRIAAGLYTAHDNAAWRNAVNELVKFDKDFC
jgi:4-hydroxyphenylacetate 3-monooxygenase/anthranilate 3-monooxygenase (FAD)/4-hydroxyphenylacetate 3-monooxygenase